MKLKCFKAIAVEAQFSSQELAHCLPRHRDGTITTGATNQAMGHQEAPSVVELSNSNPAGQAKATTGTSTMVVWCLMKLRLREAQNVATTTMAELGPMHRVACAGAVKTAVFDGDHQIISKSYDSVCVQEESERESSGEEVCDETLRHFLGRLKTGIQQQVILRLVKKQKPH